MKKIDRYEVVRLIGEGAMGQVYHARDPKLQRDVAVKVLASKLGADTHANELRERFRLEVRAVAALKHPNIVELYDFSGEDAKHLYYVMELIPGQSLFDIGREHGLMSETVALCLGHELAQALMHAHAHNVVHRDVKPENILLHDGRMVLTDFGIVKAVAADNALGVSAVARTRVLGTPGFMAPEQFSGRNIDFRTDIFALGAVLYNLTTGHLPYEGGSVEAIHANLKKGFYTKAQELRDSLSEPFCELLALCLAPKAKDRIASAQLVRDRIAEVLVWHGVTDVRDELRAYQKNPREDARSRRDGRIDNLLAELKKALKGEDSAQARAILARLESATAIHAVPPPLPSRKAKLPTLPKFATVASLASRSGARRPGLGFVLGLCVGLTIGTAAMAAYYFSDDLSAAVGADSQP